MDTETLAPSLTDEENPEVTATLAQQAVNRAASMPVVPEPSKEVAPSLSDAESPEVQASKPEKTSNFTADGQPVNVGKAPPKWSVVEQNPRYLLAEPEKRMEVLTRWHNYGLAYANKRMSEERDRVQEEFNSEANPELKQEAADRYGDLMEKQAKFSNKMQMFFAEKSGPLLQEMTPEKRMEFVQRMAKLGMGDQAKRREIEGLVTQLGEMVDAQDIRDKLDDLPGKRDAEYERALAARMDALKDKKFDSEEDRGQAEADAMELARRDVDEADTGATAIINTLKAHGITGEDLEGRVRDARKMAFDRTGKSADVLEDGRVIVDPMLSMDKKAWAQAIESTNAEPAEKLKAMAMRKTTRDRVGAPIYQVLNQGSSLFKSWAEAQPDFEQLSEGELLERFREQNQPGETRMRYGSQAASAFHGIGKQFYGALEFLGVHKFGVPVAGGRTYGTMHIPVDELANIASKNEETASAVQGALGPTAWYDLLNNWGPKMVGGAISLAPVLTTGGVGGALGLSGRATFGAVVGAQAVGTAGSTMKDAQAAGFSEAQSRALGVMMAIPEAAATIAGGAKGVEAVGQAMLAKESLWEAGKHGAYEEMATAAGQIPANMIMDPNYDARSAASDIADSGVVGAGLEIGVEVAQARHNAAVERAARLKLETAQRMISNIEGTPVVVGNSVGAVNGTAPTETPPIPIGGQINKKARAFLKTRGFTDEQIDAMGVDQLDEQTTGAPPAGAPPAGAPPAGKGGAIVRKFENGEDREAWLKANIDKLDNPGIATIDGKWGVRGTLKPEFSEADFTEPPVEKKETPPAGTPPTEKKEEPPKKSEPEAGEIETAAGEVINDDIHTGAYMQGARTVRAVLRPGKMKDGKVIEKALIATDADPRSIEEIRKSHGLPETEAKKEEELPPLPEPEELPPVPANAAEATTKTVASSGQKFVARATTYNPTTPDDPRYGMEGGTMGAAEWHGQKVKQEPLHTFEAYKAGQAPYVSVAMDNSENNPLPYGTILHSPQFPGVPFRVMDTGIAFNGKAQKPENQAKYGGPKGLGRIDVARDPSVGDQGPEFNGRVQFEVAPDQNIDISGFTPTAPTAGEAETVERPHFTPKYQQRVATELEVSPRTVSDLAALPRQALETEADVLERRESKLVSAISEADNDEAKASAEAMLKDTQRRRAVVERLLSDDDKATAGTQRSALEKQFYEVEEKTDPQEIMRAPQIGSRMGTFIPLDTWDPDVPANIQQQRNGDWRVQVYPQEGTEVGVSFPSLSQAARYAAGRGFKPSEAAVLRQQRRDAKEFGKQNAELFHKHSMAIAERNPKLAKTIEDEWSRLMRSTGAGMAEPKTRARMEASFLRARTSREELERIQRLATKPTATAAVVAAAAPIKVHPERDKAFLAVTKNMPGQVLHAFRGQIDAEEANDAVSKAMEEIRNPKNETAHRFPDILDDSKPLPQFTDKETGEPITFNNYVLKRAQSRVLDKLRKKKKETSLNAPQNESGDTLQDIVTSEGTIGGAESTTGTPLVGTMLTPEQAEEAAAVREKETGEQERLHKQFTAARASALRSFPKVLEEESSGDPRVLASMQNSWKQVMHFRTKGVWPWETAEAKKAAEEGKEVEKPGEWVEEILDLWEGHLKSEYERIRERDAKGRSGPPAEGAASTLQGQAAGAGAEGAGQPGGGLAGTGGPPARDVAGPPGGVAPARQAGAVPERTPAQQNAAALAAVRASAIEVLLNNAPALRKAGVFDQFRREVKEAETPREIEVAMEGMRNALAAPVAAAATQAAPVATAAVDEIGRLREEWKKLNQEAASLEAQLEAMNTKLFQMRHGGRGVTKAGIAANQAEIARLEMRLAAVQARKQEVSEQRATLEADQLGKTAAPAAAVVKTPEGTAAAVKTEGGERVITALRALGEADPKNLGELKYELQGYLKQMPATDVLAALDAVGNPTGPLIERISQNALDETGQTIMRPPKPGEKFGAWMREMGMTMDDLDARPRVFNENTGGYEAQGEHFTDRLRDAAGFTRNGDEIVPKGAAAVKTPEGTAAVAMTPEDNALLDQFLRDSGMDRSALSPEEQANMLEAAKQFAAQQQEQATQPMQDIPDDAMDAAMDELMKSDLSSLLASMEDVTGTTEGEVPGEEFGAAPEAGRPELVRALMAQVSAGNRSYAGMLAAVRRQFPNAPNLEADFPALYRTVRNSLGKFGGFDADPLPVNVTATQAPNGPAGTTVAAVRTPAATTAVANTPAGTAAARVTPPAPAATSSAGQPNAPANGPAVARPDGGAGSARSNRPGLRVVGEEYLPEPHNYVGADAYAVSPEQRFGINLALTRFLGRLVQGGQVEGIPPGVADQFSKGLFAPTLSAAQIKQLPEKQQRIYETMAALYGKWSAQQGQGHRAFLLGDGVGVGKTREMIVIGTEMSKRRGKPALVVTKSEGTVRQFIMEAGRMGLIKADEDTPVSTGIQMLARIGLEIGTYHSLMAGKVSQDMGGGSFGKGDYSVALLDESHSLKNQGKSFQAWKQAKTDHVLYATATPFDRPTAAEYFAADLSGKNIEQLRREFGYSVVPLTDKDGHTLYDSNGDPLMEAVPDEGMDWGGVLRNVMQFRNQMIREGAAIRREYPFWGDNSFAPGGLKVVRVQRSLKASDEHGAFMSDYHEARGFARGNILGQLSRWTEAQKAQEIMMFAKKELAEGRSVVIFGEVVKPPKLDALGQNPEFPGTVETFGTITVLEKLLERAGVPTVNVADASPKTKQRGVAAFQQGQAKVILATPSGAGTGIDLDDQIGDRPRTLIFASPLFSGDLYDQVMGRVSRRNTKSPSRVAIFVSDSFSDQRREQILTKKLQVLYRIQGGTDPDVAAFRREGEHDEALGHDILSQARPRTATGREARRLKEWGIDNGLHATLDAVAQKSPYEAHRMLAAIFKPLVGDIPVNDTRLKKNLAASYHSGLDAIRLDSTQLNLSPGNLGQTLLHETAHAILSGKIYAYQNAPHLLTAEERQHIRTLHRLMDQALDHAPKFVRDLARSGKSYDEKRDAYYEWSRKPENKGDVPWYGLIDAQEFVTEVMNRPAFQQFLNKIKSEQKKSIFTKVWDAFKRLIGVRPGSILDHAIDSISGVATLTPRMTKTDVDMMAAVLKRLDASQEFGDDPNEYEYDDEGYTEEPNYTGGYENEGELSDQIEEPENIPDEEGATAGTAKREGPPTRRFTERMAADPRIPEELRPDPQERDVRRHAEARKAFMDWRADRDPDTTLKALEKLKPGQDLTEDAFTMGLTTLGNEASVDMRRAKEAGDTEEMQRIGDFLQRLSHSPAQTRLTESARALSAARDYRGGKVLREYTEEVSKERDTGLISQPTGAGDNVHTAGPDVVKAVEKAHDTAVQEYLDGTGADVVELAKAMAEKAKKEALQKDAVAASKSVWQRIAEAAGDRIAKEFPEVAPQAQTDEEKAREAQGLPTPPMPLHDLARRTLKVFGELTSKLKPPKGAPKPKDASKAIRTVSDAISNYPELRAAWEMAKQQIRTQHGPDAAIAAQARVLNALVKPSERAAAHNAIVTAMRSARGDARVASLTKALTDAGMKPERAAKLAKMANAQIEVAEARMRALEPVLEKALEQPFTQADLRRALGEYQVNIKQLIRLSLKEQNRQFDAIAANLIDRAGLKPEDAVKMAAKLVEGFNKVATEAKQKELDRIEKKWTNPKAQRALKSASQKIIEASNLGVLNEEKYWNAMAAPLKLPGWDPEVAAELVRRVDEVQRYPEGSGPRRAAERDMLDFKRTATTTGVMDVLTSMQTGNILLPISTNWVNFKSGFVNVWLGNVMLAATTAITFRSPKAGAKVLQAAFDATMGRSKVENAMSEARAALKGELSRSYNTTEAGTEAEVLHRLLRMYDQGVKVNAGRLNWMFEDTLKGKAARGILRSMAFAGRVNAAADAINRVGAFEARAYREAMDKARKAGLTKWEDVEQFVNKELRYDDDSVAKAEAQAAQEAQQFGYTQQQQEDRVREILVQSRDQGLLDRSSRAARAATMNLDFEDTGRGRAGYIGDKVNNLLQGWPSLRLIVKFIRTGTNILDATLDWMPMWSVKRLMFGRGNWMTPETKAKYGQAAPEGIEQELQIGRVVTGHIVASLLMMWMAKGLDDDEPTLLFTRNGPIDPDENREWQARGGKRNSVGVKIGNTRVWFTYDNYVIAPVLAAFGEYSDRYRFRKDEGEFPRKEAMLYSALMGGGFLLDTSVLSGVRNLLGTTPQAFQSRSVEEATKNIGNLFGDLVTSTTPFLPVYNDTISRWFESPRQAQGLVEQVARRMPIAKLWLDKQVNALGEDVELGFLQQIPGIRRDVSVEDSDPAWRFLTRNRTPVKWNEGTQIVAKDDKGNLVKRSMNNEEAYQWIKSTGPRIKEFFSDPNVREQLMQIPDRSDRQKVINKYIHAFQAEGKAELNRQILGQ